MMIAIILFLLSTLMFILGAVFCEYAHYHEKKKYIIDECSNCGIKIFLPKGSEQKTWVRDHQCSKSLNCTNIRRTEIEEKTSAEGKTLC